MGRIVTYEPASPAFVYPYHSDRERLEQCKWEADQLTTTTTTPRDFCLQQFVLFNYIKANVRANEMMQLSGHQEGAGAPLFGCDKETLR
jgi:hypothetical protein